MSNEMVKNSINEELNIVDTTLDQISFDDDIDMQSVSKFPSLNKNEMARVYLPLFDEKGNPIARFSPYFYDDNTNTVFRAPKDKITLQKVVNILGEPKLRFGTIILKYLNVDKDGNFRPNSNLDFSLYVFLFSSDKFPTLQMIHREHNLSTCDLKFQCTDQKFQKYNMAVCKDSGILSTGNEGLIKDIINASKMLYDRYVPRFMGKKMTDDAILGLLGLTESLDAQVVNPFVSKHMSASSNIENLLSSKNATMGGNEVVENKVVVNNPFVNKTASVVEASASPSVDSKPSAAKVNDFSHLLKR